MGGATTPHLRAEGAEERLRDSDVRDLMDRLGSEHLKGNVHLSLYYSELQEEGRERIESGCSPDVERSHAILLATEAHQELRYRGPSRWALTHDVDDASCSWAWLRRLGRHGRRMLLRGWLEGKELYLRVERDRARSGPSRNQCGLLPRGTGHEARAFLSA